MSKIYLSASRMKTLDSCSWLYYCNYHLKLPASSNDGSNRGSTAHDVLECLLKTNKKAKVSKGHKASVSRREAVESFMDDPASVPSIDKLIVKYANKYGVGDPDNLDLIRSFIQVAIKNNFYLDHLELQEPEYEFCFGDPEVEGYAVRGFIDKHAVCHKTKTLEIWDYKSSKSKFPKDELAGNLQALIYSLVMRKKYPDYKSCVNFLFLKFPKAPLQTVSFTADQIEGFEDVLKYVYGVISSFDYVAAKSNLAAKSQKNSWLCGRCSYDGETKEDGSLKWNCLYKFPRKYFAVVDEEGNNLTTAYNLADLRNVEAGKVVSKTYGGCPAYF